MMRTGSSLLSSPRFSLIRYFTACLLRAFDHICMEKARYSFLIIINYYYEGLNGCSQ